MFFPVSAWFAAFVLTVTIEAPIVWVLLRRNAPDVRRLAALVVFANLATHPAVWFVFTQLFLVGTTEYVLVAEGWAVSAEALFYGLTCDLTVGRALGVAFATNLASFLVGRVVSETWPEIFR